MRFADLYPLSDFAQVADVAWWRLSDLDAALRKNPSHPLIADTTSARAGAQAADQADRVRFDAHEAHFTALVCRYLVQLRSEGRLGATGGLRGRNVDYARAWNNFVAGRPDTHETAWLFNRFSNILTNHIVRVDCGRYARMRSAEHVPGSHQAPTQEQIESAWRTLCAEVDAGNSENDTSLTGWRFERRDEKTGDRCELTFNNWQASLMRRNAQYDLEPVADVGPVPLSHAEFEIPTGRLLISDGIRIEGFSEGISFGEEQYNQGLSLESDQGRVNRTLAHASQHQLAFCQTENTYVTVFQNPDTGALAVLPAVTRDGDTTCPGWNPVGNISCDVWRILAIDEQVAADRATVGGNTNAAADLRRYLATATAIPPASPEGHHAYHEMVYSKNIVRLEVTPGRWTVHAGPNFHRRLPRHRYGLPKGVRPWCVLTPPGALPNLRDPGADTLVTPRQHSQGRPAARL